MRHKLTANLPLAAAVLLPLTACPDCIPTEPLPPLPLDEKLGPGEVRCGKVTRATELIGGPAAMGQVDRAYRCYNDRIRFLVQDGSRPATTSGNGGNLIDVDLVRDDETAPGHDTMRELVPAVGYQELKVDRIDVVNDGRDGEAAVVRVSGRPTYATITPGAYWLHQEIPGRIETDYILRPDVPYVEIRSTIYNESTDNLGPLAIADFWAVGRSSLVLTPGDGFGDPEFFTTAPFLAAGHHSHVSYGYLCAEDDIIVPLVANGVTAPLCTDNVYLSDSASYSRFLFVGDGTVESVAQPILAKRGDQTGAVKGLVRTPDGAAAAGVLVTALEGGGPTDDEATTANQARTDEEGRFTLTLFPGDYTVVAHTRGRARSADTPVTVAEGGEQTRELTLGGQGVLAVTTTFVDRAGTNIGPLPAKLSVMPLGETERPSEALGEYWDKGLTTYEVTADGQFSVPVAPGSYRLYVSRGFEFTLHTEELSIADNETAQVNAELQHALDTTGLIAGEFHQHSLGSIDATVPFPTKVLENAAEGVEFAASTDHDNIVDLRPLVEAMGLSDHFQIVPGNEVTYGQEAHFNVYPWEIDPDDPLRDVGTRIWWMKTFPVLFQDLRDMAGDAVIQINHPRSGDSAYFSSMGLDPTTATLLPQEPLSLPTLPETLHQEWAADFDAVEVNTDLGQPELFTAAGREELRQFAEEDPEQVPAFADWMALLGAGMRVGAAGNSDSHELNSGVGYPRTFLHLGTDDPREVDPRDVVEAIRAQRTFVGQGCLVELRLGETRPMGADDVVAPDALAALRVRVQAAPWITVDHIELYVNGEAQLLAVEEGEVTVDAAGALRLPLGAEMAVDEVVRLDAPVAGLPAGDLIVVAVARGGASLHPIDGGSPVCFSAPVFVDDGDGQHRPWLAATQGVLPR